MKVTNKSSAKIFDKDIEDIVELHVSANVLSKTSEIIVNEDSCVILVIDQGYDGSELVHIGTLNNEMRWGLENKRFDAFHLYKE